MTQLVQAIYKNGVFRPLDPVHVAEHEQVSLVIESPSQAPNAAAVAHQREALRKLRAEMDALPPGAPSDGLGGADHDKIPYGTK
jgi:predicted DNA-binding antitoxin AbrB/MazE fold protein